MLLSNNYLKMKMKGRKYWGNFFPNRFVECFVSIKLLYNSTPKHKYNSARVKIRDLDFSVQNVILDKAVKRERERERERERDRETERRRERKRESGRG